MYEDPEFVKEIAQPFEKCPACGMTPFIAFNRGKVTRSRFSFLFFGRRPTCAVICSNCRLVVGYEDP